MLSIALKAVLSLPPFFSAQIRFSLFEQIPVGRDGTVSRAWIAARAR
jgi:hypothetical protein